MIETVTSDTLKAPHGFFTRKGGVSTGIYAGLNCGAGSSDNPDHVAENRNRVAQTMEVETLISLHQVHSADVVTVTGPMKSKPKADAMVTATPGISLGVLTADCAPVLFDGGDVVGACHAGWKGAIGGVVEATIDAMRALGATEIRATIGPTISQRAYEVGPEFLDQFTDYDPDYDRFFAGGSGDRMMFNLPGFLLHRLAIADVDANWTGHCTYSDPDRFFSYRRTTHAGEPDYGRLIAAIKL